MIIKGIDVFKWSGDVAFAKVKVDDIKFVMLRAGLGKRNAVTFSIHHSLSVSYDR